MKRDAFDNYQYLAVPNIKIHTHWNLRSIKPKYVYATVFTVLKTINRTIEKNIASFPWIYLNPNDNSLFLQYDVPPPRKYTDNFLPDKLSW